MFKPYALIVSLSVLVALVLAEPRIQQVQQLKKNGGGGVQHPYLFLSQVPRGRSGINVKGFEIIEESNDYDDDVQYNNDANADDDDDDDADSMLDDDDNDNGSVADIVPLRKSKKQQRAKQSTFVVSDDDNEANHDDDQDDDDDDDVENVNDNDNANASELSAPVRRSQLQKIIKNAKPTQMMVAREHAGAIMVPDGIIEIEGQSVVDEKTGKAALIVPRAALDAIPDGSVVALMERSANAGLIADFNALQRQQEENNEEEERANRVIVRRRRKGGRRNVRHRRRGYNTRRRRRPNGNRRRQVVVNGNNVNRRRTNVRVINASVNRRRRGNSGAVVRPIVLQG